MELSGSHHDLYYNQRFYKQRWACRAWPGCARQAGERFPDLATRLGRLLQQHGNHVHWLGNDLVSFPVEESAWSLPDIHIIRRSAGELLELVESEQWSRVVVPRPGCGYGGLDWSAVRPLLEPIFDERFTLIHSV